MSADLVDVGSTGVAIRAALVAEIYGPGDKRRHFATTPNRRGRPRVRTRRPLPQSNNLAWFKPVVKVDDHPFVARRSFDPQRARMAAIRAAGLEDDE